MLVESVSYEVILLRQQTSCSLDCGFVLLMNTFHFSGLLERCGSRTHCRLSFLSASTDVNIPESSTMKQVLDRHVKYPYVVYI